MAVARLERMRQAYGTATKGVFEVPDDEASARLGHATVAKLDHFREVVPRVDVQQRKRQPAVEPAAGSPALERLFGQMQHHAGVLAGRKEQCRALEGSRRLAQD